MQRTHHCAELTQSDTGRDVILIGWINAVRDHGGLVFVDLRDRAGLTQVVLDPQNTALAAIIPTLRDESVIEIAGKVQPRPPETINPKLATGHIEVHASRITVHNHCATLPFPLEDEKAEKVNEDLRLTYRYLDLRRPTSYRLLEMRHRATHSVRQYLDEQKFLEIETPTLFKSTPEGAREFLVPSRLNPGQFYALSQSPQQYKQMLMVAGVERYYSIARCFRDEDLRADRQPEFTQIDLEMSFIEREDIYALIEGMLKRVWKTVLGRDVPTPFPRLAYRDAMNRFGVDKPDTRFGLELVELSDVFRASAFKVFAGAVQSGGVVKAVNAKGLADITQGELKGLEDIAKTLGAKGLAFVKAEKGEWKSPILKFFSEAEKAELAARLKIEDGDIVFFAATDWDRACAILGRMRLESAALLEARGRLSIPRDQYNFLWVVDFPLMSYDEAEARFLATHHPFTSPVPEDIALLDSNPRDVRGQHYDIVLNGVELGGGSIRIHQPEVQKKVFEDVLKIPADIVESRFGYMLRAFQFGAPPHGGIALGLDRLCAILGGRSSIRDVIAFPKTQRGQDLMVMSPGVATARQLKEAHIRVSEDVETKA
ncbi:MAG TPA: aspartate--tRNA ligase [Opitutales bacterium]|nr:aspartate--tRNA ligase [Opitutales bacterium]